MRQVFLALLAAGVKPPLFSSAKEPFHDTMPHRMLGKTSEMVPVLGLSGALLSRTADEAKSLALIFEAQKIKGKSVIDLVWQGPEETQLVGKALRDGRREKFFIVTGTDGLGKKACLRQLSETLELLGTDTIDLWMVKESIYASAPEKVFSMEGAIGAVIAAQRKKRITYAGVAGYKNTEFFLSAIRSYFDFKAAEMPMNGIGARYLEFQEKLLPRFRARNIGTIVSNPLMGMPNDALPLSPKDLLWLLWSQLISVVAAGADSAERFRVYAEMARRFETIPRVLIARMLPKLNEMK